MLFIFEDGKSYLSAILGLTRSSNGTLSQKGHNNKHCLLQFCAYCGAKKAAIRNY